jgi:hypothetical protein
MVCGLSPGAGSPERTRLWKTKFPVSWEKYREFRASSPPDHLEGSPGLSNTKRLQTQFPAHPNREFNTLSREPSRLIREISAPIRETVSGRRSTARRRALHPRHLGACNGSGAARLARSVHAMLAIRPSIFAWRSNQRCASQTMVPNPRQGGGRCFGWRSGFTQSIRPSGSATSAWHLRAGVL